MQIGIILPQNEIGDDPEAIRDFSAAAEDEGFKHLVAFDHVVGRDDYASQPFHEPFVLFGFVAVHAHDRARRPGIIIAPQRQTALLAKQAAEVDMLSGGRLRLGLGVGWNPLEYEALGEDFHTRGKRLDAQIPLMQRLWTEPRVTAELGRERLDDVGLDPPALRSIPIWLGGKGPRRGAARRRPRLGPDSLEHGRSRRRRDVRRGSRPAERRRGRRRPAPRGTRDRGLAGHEGRRSGRRGGPRSRGWAALGATHLSVQTYADAPITPAEHIERVGADRGRGRRAPRRIGAPHRAKRT